MPIGEAVSVVGAMMIKGARKPEQYHREGRVMEGNGGTRIRDHRPTLSLESTSKETSEGLTKPRREKQRRNRKEQEKEEEVNRTAQGRSSGSKTVVRRAPSLP